MENKSSDFWTKISRRYDRTVEAQIGPGIRSLVRQKLLGESNLGRLAEFGCGTGFFTKILSTKASDLVATDLSQGMLSLAERNAGAPNVTFRLEDCQETSLPDETFDSAFIGLVIHFTGATRTFGEMRRILRPGGMLIIANLDPGALSGFNRARAAIRIVYHGIVGYRTKPPKGFGKHIKTEKELCALLGRSGFAVISSEILRDFSRPSSIPVDYVRAVRSR